ncbi:hypothetical protein SCHPADRAFT_995593 [Schizopora paradoxa]|uniref:Transmembrane protein n=1 Tax=Schizopora paradoxa TaxID=27342 RepID=A0A0H2RW41_9AGAM|nr:hypothetical protein SCHPADRAFT_995593 [Schizopora paradoxa]
MKHPSPSHLSTKRRLGDLHEILSKVVCLSEARRIDVSSRSERSVSPLRPLSWSRLYMLFFFFLLHLFVVSDLSLISIHPNTYLAIDIPSPPPRKWHLEVSSTRIR